jgi:hypothetical protein
MKNILLLFLFFRFIDAGIGVGISSPGALPVELNSFTASNTENVIILNWQTATEVNNYGFNIEKRIINLQEFSDWENIGFIEGHGNSNSPKNYTFVDNTNIKGVIQYRLKQIDTDGKFKYSEIIEIDNNIPKDFALYQNYPNPFNPSTIISYSIPEESFVSIKVYDLLGKEVATLVDERQTAGNYQKSFNADGLSNGVYFYRIQTNSVNNSVDFIETKKMSILK